MNDLWFDESIKQISGGKLTYSVGRNNSNFYSLEDIANAFDFDGDPCTIAVIFADRDIDSLVSHPELYDDEFNKICKCIKILEDAGGRFAYDVPAGKKDHYWGICVPEFLV